MPNPAGKPLKVFWSYAHEDEAWRVKLGQHFAALRRTGLIEDWHDRRISPGSGWRNEIHRHLLDADIVLLLLSAAFFDSDYCWGEEMTKALARHRAEQARVIPIILHPCSWDLTPLAELQAVPKDALAISLWLNEHAAMHDVTRQVSTLAKSWRREFALPLPHPPAAAGPSLSRKRARDDAEPISTPPADADAPLSRERERAGVRVPAAPKLKQKNGIYIGAEWDDLPDFAAFKDDDLPWLPEMVMLPAGTFLMGSPPGEAERAEWEGPQHQVEISRRFAIGRYAVTFDEYDHFCEVTKREKLDDARWGRVRRPVINVSWEDAQAYLAWLSGETGQAYRLPSEAEWEYACRAGKTTPFSFGNTITPEQVNYNGNHPYGGGKKGPFRKQTVPVGSLPANSWGLHEMHGNVWELVS
jgi:Uncharacterized conserved protein